MIQSEYLKKIFDPGLFRETVDEAVESIKKWNKPYDTIAFTGVSGAGIAFPLSLALNKPLLCIRKARSSTHSSHSIEGYINVKRYIVVDDFVDTGTTVVRIVRQINTFVPEAEMVGIYLYRPGVFGAYGFEEIQIKNIKQGLS